MNDFDHIQELWQQQQAPPRRAAAELVRLIRRKQRREGIQMLCGTLGLALSFFGILFIGFHYPFAYASTYAGMVLILASVAIAVVMNSRLLSLLRRSRIKEDTDNATLLAGMRRYRERQHFMQTRFISAYFIGLTLGLMLYMFELTHRDPLFMSIAYTLTLGWVAIAWWYIRPRTIRKQTERTRDIITHLEDLEKQLGEP